MSITDVISHLRLDFFPQVALVIFLIVFVAVVIRNFSPRLREDFDACMRLPLEDDASNAVDHDQPTQTGARR